MKLIYSLLFFLLQGYFVFAQQYKITTKRTDIENLLYSVNENDEFEQYPNFYFPEFRTSDSVLYHAIKPFKKNKHHKPSFIRSDIIWDIQLNNIINCHLDSTVFYFRHYVNNIKDIKIYIHSASDNSWYINEFTPDFQNYQFPIQIGFSGWKELNNSKGKYLISDSIPYNKIDRIIFASNKIDYEQNYEFCIADFKIYNTKVNEVEINHPFFDPLVKKRNSLAEIDFNSFSKDPGQSFVISPFVFYTMTLLQYAKFDITDLSKITNKKEMIYNVFYQILDKYPFYSERSLTKDLIINRFKNYFNDDNRQYEVIQDSIQNLISEFHDPHFYIYSENKYQNKNSLGKVYGPIRIFEINNEFYVAAVFDPDLEESIKPGMKVLKVDGINIHNLISSLSDNLSGTNEVRREKATSYCLKRYKSDSCILTLANNKIDTSTVKIYYNKKNMVPDGFIVKQGTIKMLTSNTVYYKLNHCINGTYIQFLNNYTRFKEAENLVLDLRNAPGGEENEIINIASCFIRKPSVYNHYVFNIRESYNIKETTVLKPNQKYNLSDLNVIILINERTACAFEAFVNFMRLYTNTTLIGTAQTAGAYICCYDLKFPWGLTCKINSLGKPLLPNGESIENKGIEPDIWVSINSVGDLAPYDDKVLKTAIKLISK